MPFLTVIRKDNNSGILRADYGHSGKGKLLVLRVVQGIVRNLDVGIRLELMHVQIVAAGPGKNEVAKKAQQKPEAGSRRLAAFDIGRIVYLGAGLILRGDVHIHE